MQADGFIVRKSSGGVIEFRWKPPALPMGLTVYAYVNLDLSPNCYIASTGELAIADDPFEPSKLLSAAEVLNVKENPLHSLYSFVSQCVSSYSPPLRLFPKPLSISVTLSRPKLGPFTETISIEHDASPEEVSNRISSMLMPVIGETLEVYGSRTEVTRNELLSELESSPRAANELATIDRRALRIGRKLAWVDTHAHLLRQAYVALRKIFLGS